MFPLKPLSRICFTINTNAARVWINAAIAHEFAQGAGQTEFNALVVHIALLDLATKAIDECLNHAVDQILRNACSAGHKHCVDPMKPSGI